MAITQKREPIVACGFTEMYLTNCSKNHYIKIRKKGYNFRNNTMTLKITFGSSDAQKKSSPITTLRFRMHNSQHNAT